MFPCNRQSVGDADVEAISAPCAHREVIRHPRAADSTGFRQLFMFDPDQAGPSLPTRYMVIAYIVMAYKVIAYIVMAYTVMAYKVMAYIVKA